MFKLKCVSTVGAYLITVGNLYEAYDECEKYYNIKNDNGNIGKYDKHFFEKVQDKEKFTILCVDKMDYSYIKEGKYYEAEDYNTNYYQLVNDEGDVALYRKTCFVVPKLFGIDTSTINTPPTKPPLGLRPRKIYWEELNYHRRIDILAAMQRRVEAKMDIPVEWCKELIDLVIADTNDKLEASK